MLSSDQSNGAVGGTSAYTKVRAPASISASQRVRLS